MSRMPSGVRLRPLRESDWTAMHAWASDPEVCRFQAWGPNSEEETRELVRAGVAAMDARPQKLWVYMIVASDEVIGHCDLHLRGHGVAEIGYAVRRDRWGRGLATAAATLALDIGFADLGLHRVFASCDPRNTASSAVLRRLGMQHEGRLRENVLIRDGWRNSDIYGLLAAEWVSDGSRG